MQDGPAERRGVEFYCSHCFRIEVMQYVTPRVCPQCGAEWPWRPVYGPQWWQPTENDKRFLSRLHIAAS